MKTMIERSLTVFCKLVIFSVVMDLSENFTVRAAKCRPYYKQSKAC